MFNLTPKILLNENQCYKVDSVETTLYRHQRRGIERGGETRRAPIDVRRRLCTLALQPLHASCVIYTLVLGRRFGRNLETRKEGRARSLLLFACIMRHQHSSTRSQLRKERRDKGRRKSKRHCMHNASSTLQNQKLSSEETWRQAKKEERACRR